MTEVDSYQGMSRGVLAEILALISTYDRKFNPTDADVLAWHDIAVRNRWTHHEATEQIRSFFERNDTDEWITPGKLNMAIRRARQDRMSREQAPPRRDDDEQRAWDGKYLVGDDPDWGKNNNDNLEQVHAEAMVVACPFCRQPIGERCKNTRTGNASKIPHPGRLTRAQGGGRRANLALLRRHPDLMDKLREPPCCFTSPETWTGYLAPERTGDGALINSPFRKQVADLIAEAERREAS